MKKIFLLILWLAIGTVAFEGFQCSSKELTTAKVAYNNKEYDRAIEFAKQEVAKNPKNTEAYLVLAQAYIKKEDWMNAAKAAKQADEQQTDKIPAQQPKMLLFQIWTESYNRGVNNLNRYYSNNITRFLDSASYYFSVGKIARPDLTDFYYLMGTVYEAKHDTASAIKEYTKFVELSKNDIEIFQKYNLFIGIPRNDVIAKMGKPVLSTPGNYNGIDSTITDLYSIDNKDLYIFYKDNKKDLNYSLFGLRYDPPQNWLEAERSAFTPFNTAPIAGLAQLYYAKGDYNQALNYLKLLGTLEPNNENANSFLVQIYQDMGKPDDAFKYVNELIQKNPKNKFYWTQLADMQQNDKKYDEAIASYEKALEIDPTYYVAIRNIAAAYKNKASVIQRQQADKLDKDKNYKPNPEEYFPYLRKSAEYFEKATKTKQYQNDYRVYADLANIYFVLNETDKLNQNITKLESLESSVPEGEKESYYLNLLKLYSDLKRSDKVKEIQEKIK